MIYVVRLVKNGLDSAWLQGGICMTPNALYEMYL